MSFGIDHHLESLGEVRCSKIEEVVLTVKYRGSSNYDTLTLVNVNGQFHKKEELKKFERFSRSNYVRPDYLRPNHSIPSQSNQPVPNEEISVMREESTEEAHNHSRNLYQMFLDMNIDKN